MQSFHLMGVFFSEHPSGWSISLVTNETTRMNDGPENGQGNSTSNIISAITVYHPSTSPTPFNTIPMIGCLSNDGIVHQTLIPNS